MQESRGRNPLAVFAASLDVNIKFRDSRKLWKQMAKCPAALNKCRASSGNEATVLSACLEGQCVVVQQLEHNSGWLQAQQPFCSDSNIGMCLLADT